MTNTAELDLLLAEIDLLKTELQLQIPLLDPAMQLAMAIEFTHDSNALEGSSLNLRETDMVIRNGLMLPGKPMADNLAALNHYQAIQFIQTQANEQALLTEGLLQHLYGILSRAIHRQPPGDVYRHQPGTLLSGQAAPTPEQIPELIAGHVHWLNLEGPFMHPIVYAAETHLRLLNLLPFPSGNGLCARLAMNLLLLNENYPWVNLASDPASREAYVAAIANSQAEGDLGHWLRFFASQVMHYYQHLTRRLQQTPAAEDTVNL